MLHVTNGDSAGGAGLSLDQLSEERAAFIAEAGWGELEEVRRDFLQRDEALRNAQAQEEIVLWFEHDLYDQLQLIQVLDWFAQHPRPRLTLICGAEYVGTMSPARMQERFAARQPVTGEQIQESRAAWAAFGAPDPSGVARGHPMAFRSSSGACWRFSRADRSSGSVNGVRPHFRG